MMFKRGLCAFLVVCILISLFALSASAEEAATTDDSKIEVHYYYSSDNKTWTEVGWRDVNKGMFHPVGAAKYHRITGIRIQRPHAAASEFRSYYFSITPFFYSTEPTNLYIVGLNGWGEKQLSNSITSVDRYCYASTQGGFFYDVRPDETTKIPNGSFDFFLSANFNANYLNTEYLTYNFSIPCDFALRVGQDNSGIVSSGLYCSPVTQYSDLSQFYRNLINTAAADIIDAIGNIDFSTIVSEIRSGNQSLSDIYSSLLSCGVDIANIESLFSSVSSRITDIYNGIVQSNSTLASISADVSDINDLVSLIKNELSSLNLTETNSYNTLLSILSSAGDTLASINVIKSMITQIQEDVLQIRTFMGTWSSNFATFLVQFAVLWRTAWGYVRIRLQNDGSYQIENGSSSFFNALLVSVNAIASHYQQEAQLSNQANDAGADDALNDAYNNVGNSFGSLSDFAGISDAGQFYDAGRIAENGSGLFGLWFSTDNYNAINYGSRDPHDEFVSIYDDNLQDIKNNTGGGS